MANEKSKILVLVEGEKTDYKLMRKLFAIYGMTDKYEIVSYNTNIYTLYNEMFCEGDPSAIDTLQNLKEHETNPEKKKIFDMRYSDILLIFDLDPQDPLYTPEKISAMASYFCESSDMGKLYINFPMVESFYHMKSIPDPDFDTYTASLEELKDRKYKKRVNQENRNHDYNKFATSRSECNTVIRQHIAKAWNLLSSSDNTTLFDPPSAIEILEKQLSALDTLKKVYVLCTCCFYIAEYNADLLN